MKRVSVIVPVYNVEKYLRDCLDSILSQDFEEFEIICVEDCSSDGSMKILREYEKNTSIMRVYCHDVNSGLSAARNTGLKFADGEYIMFVDSDDILKKDAVKKAYEYIADSKADVAYFNFTYLRENGYEYIKENDKKDFGSYRGTYFGRDLFSMFIINNEWKVESWRQIYRKKFLIDNDLWFYEGIIHEDLLYSFQVAMAAKKAVNFNEELYIYRQHSGSINSTKDGRRAESIFIVLCEIFSWCRSHAGELTESQWKGIKKYITTLYADCQRAMLYINEDYEAVLGNDVQKCVFELYNRGLQDKCSRLSDSQIEYLRRCDRVIVYGAGTIGTEVVNMLRRRGIIIFSVAVSSLENNPKEICGVKVLPIEELGLYRNDSTVLLAVAAKYKSEIENKLMSMGFHDIIALISN